MYKWIYAEYDKVYCEYINGECRTAQEEDLEDLEELEEN